MYDDVILQSHIGLVFVQEIVVVGDLVLSDLLLFCRHCMIFKRLTLR